MAGFAETIKGLLKDLNENTGIGCFIETGTFKGKTAEYAAGLFKKVYTIELKESLFWEAKNKFKDVPNVTCLQGDSPKVLADLLQSIKEDALFFLDAHWAGELSTKGDSDTPLMQELEVISATRKAYKDIIIIDDLSFFGIKGSLPRPHPTQYFPKGGMYYWDWRHVNKEDIVRLFPGKQFKELDDRLIISD